MHRAALLFLLLTACDGGRPFIDCCFDTSTRRDTGSGEPGDVGSADLSITYGFAGAANCAEAGLAAVNVTATRRNDDPVQFAWPCSDEAIRMSEVPRGSWEFALEGGPETRAWSGTSSFEVGLDDAELSVELTCTGTGC